MVDERALYLTAISITAIASLTVLAVAYWLIMREDATVLTIVSATIGGALGYAIRYLTSYKKKEG